MAINANEMTLLLSELPFTDSVIQDVSGHDFHSFTLSLFSKSEKAYLLYVEVGTPTQRFCKTNIMRKKEKKMQRFIQYLRANIVGSRIEEVHQVKGDRLFYLKCTHQGIVRYLIFRFYSGPGANIFVTDENFTILEAMMRRPQRGEEKGQIFTLPPDKESSLEKFPVREYSGPSFNEFIDREADKEEKKEEKEELIKAIEEKRDRELSSLNQELKNINEKIKRSENATSYKESADLLSSSSYLIKRGATSITLTDYEGKNITIALDASLSPAENINAYYQRYKRTLRLYESAITEKEEIEKELLDKEAFYKTLLEEEDIRALSKALQKESKTTKGLESSVGIRVQSGGFDILVGRNAKENDELLRHHTRGSDIWMHTRFFPGGYVIIKAKKDKSVPLEVLLDGASLAIHYSKAKSTGKADLYYTQVKYLRRIKDGKTGLVTPTQEKNLTVTLDEKRIKRLLFGLKEE